VFRFSSCFNLFFVFFSSRRDNAWSSSRFIHYDYRRCICFFCAFVEGDKSTETSMCKCCDIKNDNGKRLLLQFFTHYKNMCLYVQRHTHIIIRTMWVWKIRVLFFFVLFHILLLRIFFVVVKKKKGKNDEHDCQLYSLRTKKKINKNVTRVNKTGKCAKCNRLHACIGVYSCRAKVFFSN